MDNEELYKQRIQALENKVRALTNAQTEYYDWQKRTAQAEILRMFINYVSMVNRSIEHPDAIKSGTDYIMHILKEKYQVFQDDNKIWWITINGETIKFPL